METDGRGIASRDRLGLGAHPRAHAEARWCSHTSAAPGHGADRSWGGELEEVELKGQAEAQAVG